MTLHPSAKDAPVCGTTPAGSTDSDSAARAVQRMFTDIAPQYDLLNHLLSFGIDHVWWQRTAGVFEHILSRPDARVLDLCCGTGDMTFALARRAGKSDHPILGADFAHAMLVRAQEKSRRNHICWIEADALRLPFRDNSFDLITSAFGFRNLADYAAGLREIFRVLAPGGEVGILEFGEPAGMIGSIYRVYFRRVLPLIGTIISGVKGPYAYLPESVARFPSPEQMLEQMRVVGFTQPVWISYTFGIAGLYRARKPR